VPRHVILYNVVAPFFVIYHPTVLHFRSPVYDRVSKKDGNIDMILDSPVILSGDIMIEFYNKPKMMAKVRFPFDILSGLSVC